MKIKSWVNHPHIFFKFIDTICAAPNYISNDNKEQNKNSEANNYFNDMNSLYKSNNDQNHQKSSDLHDIEMRFMDSCDSITSRIKNQNTKKCVLDKLKKTHCADNDMLCLCDSKASYRVIYDCSEAQNDLSFEFYFDRLCFSASLHPHCTSAPNPFFPRIICKDPFEGSELDENARNCIKKAAKHSLCKNISYVSCLCDSRTFIFEVGSCIEDISYGENVGIFLNTLCRMTTLPPGCTYSSDYLSNVIENEKNGGKRLYKIKMKETIFLILGITIPISLGLMEI